MDKMMTHLQDLPWDVGPYPGSRMKIYPMIEGKECPEGSYF